MQSAVFLDRDGVITIPEMRNGRSYAPRSLDQLAFYPEAKASLARLKQAGYLLLVVTNQPDVGNNVVDLSVLEAMHEKTFSELPIDDLMACYHRQDEGCHCRKPLAGMLKILAHRWQLDLEKSYMIGDRWSDITAGKVAGCKTIFIDHQYQEALQDKPDFFVKSLSAAAKIVTDHS